MAITLTGTNDFARSAALNELVAAFVAGQGELALERLDGEEVAVARIEEALTSLPFLASRKLVVLRAPSLSKGFIERAEQLLVNLPETTDIIVYEPKLDKRTAYYKLLKSHTDFREFNELDEDGLARWLVERAKAANGTLSVGDARLLIDRVGVSQQLLASELDKLLLYEPEISAESIRLLTERSPQSTIFELLEAAFAGNTRHTLALYGEQRALRVEPPQIIAMLAWQLHVLALLKTAGERSPQVIASEAKINPYVVNKSMAIARRLTLPELKRLVDDLVGLDIKLKSQSIDADEALQNFLLALAGAEA